MSIVREHSDDLVMVSKSCDKWTDCFTISQIVQKFQLVLYPRGTASDINFLDGYVSLAWHAVSFTKLVVQVRSGVPLVDVLVIEKILCFIDRRKGTYSGQWMPGIYGLFEPSPMRSTTL